MELFHTLISIIRDPGPLLAWGYPGLALVIFAETGALTFFLPGDSLLVTAGAYAADPGTSAARLSLLLLNVILIPAAIIGDGCSYWIGAKTGPRIFNRPRSRFFRPEHVKAAHAFYERHGGKAIILARFMPIVRTFVPVIAGVGGMPYRRFAFFNVIGGAAWISSMTVLGYTIGHVEFVRKRIELVIIAVVLASISPGVVAWLRVRRDRVEKRAPAPE